MGKRGYVYILTNTTATVLYVGVSSDLVKRVYQHKEKLVDGFSKKYNLTKLVYYELHDDIQDAIKREKYIKGKSRTYKLGLIREKNHEFNDLYQSIL